jgi:oligoribonuclease
MANRFSALSLGDDDLEETGETFVFVANPKAARQPARRRRDGARYGHEIDQSDDDEIDGSGTTGRNGETSSTPTREEASSSPSRDPAEQEPTEAQSTRGQRRPRPFGSGSMLWIDLEMTGLDAGTDHILELACVLSNAGLDRLINGPELVIDQPEEVLQNMNAWCTLQHNESGLVERVRASTVSLREAEEQMVAFVKAHAAPGVLNLAGNAVYKDKEFLERYMPELMAIVSWRVIDVSTLNELAHRWFPNALRKMPRKKGTHRAKADVYASIEELKFYRRSLFKPHTEQSAGRR